MKAEELKRKFKVVLPGVVLGVTALGILIVMGVVGKSQRNSLLELDGEISSLKRDIKTAEVAAKESNDMVVSSVTGVDTKKVDSDNQKARTFFKDLLTWNNLEEYNARRQLLLETYGMNEDDVFLKSFMPNVDTVTDADGNEYLRESVNVVQVAFTELSSRVVAMDDDAYTYFTEVSLTVEDVKKPGSTGTALCIFQYTMDGEGNLSNLSGYTVADIQE